MGTYFGWHDNLRARMLATHVAHNLGLNAIGFASFCGLYQLMHCSLEKRRGRSDVLNATFSGFATGDVPPFACRESHSPSSIHHARPMQPPKELRPIDDTDSPC